MQCRIQDLRRKEVINICDGCRLGYVADVDIRVPEGQVVAIGTFFFFTVYSWLPVDRFHARVRICPQGATKRILMFALLCYN